MIKTLSPYYYSVPLVNPNTSVVCNTYTLKLYVWNGLKSAIPILADYESTKINAAASNTTDKIDIARLVNDFITFDCSQSVVTSLEDGNNQVWVKVEVYYDDQPTIAQLQMITLATKGYGYFMEGENPQIPANKILLEGDEFKVNRGGAFVLPILLDEVLPITTPTLMLTSVVFTDLGGGSGTLTFTFSGDFTFTEVFAQNKAPADMSFSGDLFTLPFPSPQDAFVIGAPVVGLEYRIRAFDSITSTYIMSNEVLVT